jgi:hypothetical protein
MKSLYLKFLLFFIFIPCVVFGNSFSDVTKEYKFYKEINILKDRNVIRGYKDNNYQPESFVNRAELTKMLISSKYSSSEITRCDTNMYSFPDVKNDTWYAPYVCVAKKNNIIDGYRDGLFHPESYITLPETIKIIYENSLNTTNYQYSSDSQELNCKDHNITNKSISDCNKYKNYYNQWFMKYILFFYKNSAFNIPINFQKINEYNIPERDYLYIGGITKMDGKINLIRDYKITRGEMAFFIVESLYKTIYDSLFLTGEFVKIENDKINISDFQEEEMIEVKYIYLKNVTTDVLLRHDISDENGILKIDYTGDYNFSEKDINKKFSFSINLVEMTGQFRAKLINE